MVPWYCVVHILLPVYGIYRQLHLNQIRNAYLKCILYSSVVHIWSKKTQITNVFLPFHSQNHSQIYLIDSKLNYNFQLVLLFCFGENNGPLKMLLGQSRTAYLQSRYFTGSDACHIIKMFINPLSGSALPLTSKIVWC